MPGKHSTDTRKRRSSLGLAVLLAALATGCSSGGDAASTPPRSPGTTPAPSSTSTEEPTQGQFQAFDDIATVGIDPLRAVTSGTVVAAVDPAEAANGAISIVGVDTAAPTTPWVTPVKVAAPSTVSDAYLLADPAGFVVTYQVATPGTAVSSDTTTWTATALAPDGTTRWTAPIAGPGAAVTTGVLITENDNGTLSSYNLSTKPARPLWTRPGTTPQAAEGVVLTDPDTSTLTAPAFDARTGAQLWTFTGAASGDGLHLVTAGAGNLYLEELKTEKAGNRRQLKLVNARTGKLVPGAKAVNSPAATTLGLIDAKTGRAVIYDPTPDSSTFGPRSLDLRTGALKDLVPPKDAVNAQSVPTAAGNGLVWIRGNGMIAALDVLTGAPAPAGKAGDADTAPDLVVESAAVYLRPFRIVPLG